jgi:hypothetical protein
MRLRKSCVYLIIILTSFIGIAALRAQDAINPFKAIPLIPSPEAAPEGGFYRLDITMHEMEDGKTLNTRNYSISMKANKDTGAIRISHDVPITSGATPDPLAAAPAGPVKSPFKSTQKSVSVSLDCVLKEKDSNLELGLRGEISGVIPPDQVKGYPPISRDIFLVSTAPLTPGKTTMISSVDDPGSNRQFKIEATATKLK